MPRLLGKVVFEDEVVGDASGSNIWRPNDEGAASIAGSPSSRVELWLSRR